VIDRQYVFRYGTKRESQRRKDLDNWQFRLETPSQRPHFDMNHGLQKKEAMDLDVNGRLDVSIRV